MACVVVEPTGNNSAFWVRVNLMVSMWKFQIHVYISITQRARE